VRLLSDKDNYPVSRETYEKMTGEQKTRCQQTVAFLNPVALLCQP
jgi:hypothetical protein